MFEPPSFPRPAKAQRGLATAGMAGAGVAALIGLAWLVRLPLADALIENGLAERGAPGTVDVARLDFGGLALADVRVGPAAAPDLTAERIEARLRWSWLSPKLAGVEIEGLRLRGRADETGVSFGSLDRLLEGDEAGEPVEIPAVAVTLRDATAALDTPFGPATFAATASGTLTRDFIGSLTLSPSAFDGDDAQARGLFVRIDAKSGPEGLNAKVDARAAQLNWPALGLVGTDLSFSIDATSDGTLGSVVVAGNAAAAGLEIGGFAANALTLQAKASAPTLAAAQDLALLRLDGDLRAGQARLYGLALDRAQATLSLAGGEGPFRLRASSGQAGPLTLTEPELAGTATLSSTAQRRLAAQTTLALRVPKAALSPDGRRAALAAVPALEGAPVGPLFARARAALDGALAGFSVEAALLGSWSDGAGAIWLNGPLALRADNGAFLRLSATAADGAAAGVARLSLPEGAVRGAGRLEAGGPDLPALDLAVDGFSIGEDGLDARAQARPLDWRHGGAALALPEGARLAVRMAAGGGALTLTAATRMSGPAGPMAVRGLAMPLALEVDWTERNLTVRPNEGRCADLALDGVEGLGFSFGAGRARLCPAPGGAFFASREGAAGGGFDLGPLTLAGRMSGDADVPARFATGGVRLRLAPAGAATRTTAVTGATALDIDFAADRTLRLAAPTLDAIIESGGGGWSAKGSVADAVLEDPALPVTVTEIEGRWTLAPEGARAPLRFADGRARVVDKEQPTRFSPLLVQTDSGVIDEGRVLAEGRFALAADETPLGQFTAEHRLESATGEADVTVRDLTFSPSLEAAEVTPLALGVVENVRGQVDADAKVTWTAQTIQAAGTVSLDAIAAATAGLGPISGVNGVIVFDDLFLLTTPPGQTLRVGKVNPGVAARDGVVRFQLLRDGEVAIEDVRFPFAKGTLSVDPARITIGAPESRYVLRLADVDVATFLAEMELTNLAATGTIGGVLPLEVKPLGATIRDGVLESGPGGGVIAYEGPGAEEAGGSSEFAFDALKGFRYDRLTLGVEGDLEGDIRTVVQFSGVNLEPVRPFPQFPQLAARELPFRYNVRITAPFKALADQANDTLNPQALMRRTRASIEVETAPADSAPVQSPPATQGRRD